MTDLVTGGAGFIGRHLVRLLVERGERVRVLDTDPGHDLPPEVDHVRGSITDPETVRRAVRRVRRVYHLAANSYLWVPSKSEFARVNAGGTRTVLREAATAGVERVVHTSSEVVFVHAGLGRRASVDESLEVPVEAMLGPYCRSKREAELAALEAAGSGLPVVVVNPTLPLGPGDRRLTAPTRMVRDFLNQRHPAYMDCTLNVIDVRDAALGHVLAAERGRPGERYILGHANLTLAELLGHLQAISGIAMPRMRIPYWVALASAGVSELLADAVTQRYPLAPVTGVRLARYARPFSNAKARHELGLTTRPLCETLADAIAWLAEAGYIEQLPRGGAQALDRSCDDRKARLEVVD